MPDVDLVPEGEGGPRHRRILSFQPRGGRMNDVQRRAWVAHADRWFLDWYRDFVRDPAEGPAGESTTGPATDRPADPAGGPAGESTTGPATDRPADPAGDITREQGAGLPGDPATNPAADSAEDRAPAPGRVVTFDQPAVFGREAPLVLEIGPGMGDATAAMAATRPEVDVLAVEVYKPGIAQTFVHLAAAGVTNVRLLRADVVDVLERAIPPGRLDEIWTFFPDPWPKRKHHKRRLITEEFAALAASRLRTGGAWWLATDWEPYARQMISVLSSCPLLANPHADRPGGWAPRPDFRPTTRFERRGENEGRPIFDLEFVRV